MTRLLGIDIGTTATKAIVIDADGSTIAQAERPTALHSPHAGWAEEDPGQWWHNVTSLTAELPLDGVAAVGVSGMVPCVVLMDTEGRPVRPSIQQNDARASAEVGEMRAEFDEADILARTGSPITQQSVAPTLRWLRRHEPAALDAAVTLMGSYDHIAHRLTGERAVEHNWALESGLWDWRAGTWAADVCAAAGLDPALLPPVKASSEVVGTVTAASAAATGLRPGTPVVAGSADHVASAFAAGLVRDGDLLVKLGGAGDILLSTGTPMADPRLYLDFHLVPGKFLPNGCMAASGSFIRWFQAQMAGGADLATLDDEARRAGVGAGGIVALPYMLGEKTPINDPMARGAFVGLHLGHTRGHLFRAVLESISFGFRHHLDVFAELGARPGRVRVTNGGARSVLWKQVTADVIGHPLQTLGGQAGSALGAAFTAGIGVGAIAGWDEIERFTTPGEVIEPDMDAHRRYEEIYMVYRELYGALAPASHRLAGRPEVAS